MSLTKEITIEDYYGHVGRRRYGGTAPLHEKIREILAREVGQYDTLLSEFTQYIDQFLGIHKHPTPGSPEEPAWLNGFFPALDAIVLYGLISTLQPKHYVEIGSGHSTTFAARAKQQNSPSTKLISIDPSPRVGIDALCDTVIREPLEDCDLTLFDELSENDLLFFDGSHRVLQNSDATVFFFDVVPRIRKQVYVHVHDIFWPFDYPDEWSQRMYSEQYVLGSMLLYAHDKFDIILPNTYISWCTDLPDRFQQLWRAPHLDGIEKHGSSFWFTMK